MVRGILLFTAGLALHAQAQIYQRDIEPRLYLGSSSGYAMADVHMVSGPKIHHPFGVMWGLEGGLSFTYRDRIGLAFGASMRSNSYLFVDDTASAVVHYGVTTVDVRAYWWPALRERNESSLALGCGFGWSLNRSASNALGTDHFSLSGYMDHFDSPFVAPEIGWVRGDGTKRVEWSLRYVKHFDGPAAVHWTVASPASRLEASTDGDHVAMVMRKSIGLPKPPHHVPMPHIDHDDRYVDTLIALTTKRDRIVLRIRDNAEVDGDTISVFHNEWPVLSGFMLTHRTEKVRVRLTTGSNTLLVVAHNEGRIPPNTASCTLRCGHGKQRLLLRTTERMDQAVVIRRM
ncbi:MAG: hypothetical protein ABI432_11630 [Flavobacteriales bacterium]